MNEGIHGLRLRDGKGLIFKFDFAKIYDSLNRECMLHVMECLNFDNK